MKSKPKTAKIIAHDEESTREKTNIKSTEYLFEYSNMAYLRKDIYDYFS
jgi:hypothetical protein